MEFSQNKNRKYGVFFRLISIISLITYLTIILVSRQSPVLIVVANLLLIIIVTTTPIAAYFFKSNLYKIISLIPIYIVINYLFVLQPFEVRGASMAPNILSGEILIEEKISYFFSPPKRKDIVIFKDKNNESINISRIIGLPFETITIKGGKVYINSLLFAEKYLPSNVTTIVDGENSPNKYTLGRNEYFVMGDNRAHSFDSRKNGFVNTNDVKGRVFYRFRPKFEKLDINNLVNNDSIQTSIPLATDSCFFYNNHVTMKSNGLGVIECSLLSSIRIDVSKSYCETSQSKKRAYFQEFLQGKDFGYAATLNDIDKNEKVELTALDYDGKTIKCLLKK